MTLSKKTLLTIVTEANLESLLLRDLERLGVKGYTLTDARGKGSRGVRNSDWDEAKNLRIEIVCARELAEKVLAHLMERYYAHYAMIAFLSEVEVMRAEKF